MNPAAGDVRPGAEMLLPDLRRIAGRQLAPVGRPEQEQLLLHGPAAQLFEPDRVHAAERQGIKKGRQHQVQAPYQLCCNVCRRGGAYSPFLRIKAQTGVNALGCGR